jgi:hypothetical protein
MQDFNSSDDQLTYRLVLLRRDWVLVETEGNKLCLPRIGVSKRARAAWQLQNAIRMRWSGLVVILDFLNDFPISPVCIAELHSRRTPKGLSAVPLDQVEMPDLTNRERQIVANMSSGNPDNRGPFSRTGWIHEALEWVSTSTGQSFPFTAEFEQYNAGGSFALMRFASRHKRHFWLKAVGEPNLKEFSITTTLAQICPKYLPPMIAARCDWKAWVMEDAGQSMHQVSRPDTLGNAVIAMAELQKKTCGYADGLLNAGATDQRISVLGAHIRELVAYLEEAMQLQTSTKVPRLSTRRLREIGGILEDSCSAMEWLGVPDTIMHNDLNRGNILTRKRQCVFIDWCEASIGNPFLTLQQLLLLIPGNCAKADEMTCQLKQQYRRSWADSLCAWRIDRAFVLAPLLVLVSHLYGRGDWLNSERRDDPQVQGYARTLGRRMDRAALAPHLKDVLCR